MATGGQQKKRGAQPGRGKPGLHPTGCGRGGGATAAGTVERSVSTEGGASSALAATPVSMNVYGECAEVRYQELVAEAVMRAKARAELVAATIEGEQRDELDGWERVVSPRHRRWSARDREYGVCMFGMAEEPPVGTPRCELPYARQQPRSMARTKQSARKDADGHARGGPRGGPRGSAHGGARGGPRGGASSGGRRGDESRKNGAVSGGARVDGDTGGRDRGAFNRPCASASHGSDHDSAFNQHSEAQPR